MSVYVYVHTFDYVAPVFCSLSVLTGPGEPFARAQSIQGSSLKKWGPVFGPVQQLGRGLLQAEETAQDFEFPLKPMLNLSSSRYFRCTRLCLYLEKWKLLVCQVLQIHDDWRHTSVHKVYLWLRKSSCQVN